MAAQEIVCFDKLTTSKELKITPLFREACITDQLSDTNNSHITLNNTRTHGAQYSRACPDYNAGIWENIQHSVEPRQVENWSKCPAVGADTRFRQQYSSSK